MLTLLGLNAPSTTPSAQVADAAPQLTARLDGIHPAVGGRQHGFDALQLLSRRGPETGLTLLAVVTHLPYSDNRPNQIPTLPAERHYAGWYFLSKSK